MKHNRITFLENHRKELQKGIWGLEFDIVHLERQKITCRDGELNDIANGITMAKSKINAYESRIKSLDDVINELKSKEKKK